MSLIDLIVAIVVVTILVTVVVGLLTYVAYKFRLSRQPRGGEAGGEEGGTRYFFVHEPPSGEASGDDGEASGGGGAAPGGGGAAPGEAPGAAEDDLAGPEEEART